MLLGCVAPLLAIGEPVELVKGRISTHEVFRRDDRAQPEDLQAGLDVCACFQGSETRRNETSHAQVRIVSGLARTDLATANWLLWPYNLVAGATLGLVPLMFVDHVESSAAAFIDARSAASDLVWSHEESHCLRWQWLPIILDIHNGPGALAESEPVCESNRSALLSRLSEDLSRTIEQGGIRARPDAWASGMRPAAPEIACPCPPRRLLEEARQNAAREGERSGD